MCAPTWAALPVHRTVCVRAHSSGTLSQQRLPYATCVLARAARPARRLRSDTGESTLACGHSRHPLPQGPKQADWTTSTTSGAKTAIDYDILHGCNELGSSINSKFNNDLGGQDHAGHAAPAAPAHSHTPTGALFTGGGSGEALPGTSATGNQPQQDFSHPVATRRILGDHIKTLIANLYGSTCILKY